MSTTPLNPHAIRVDDYDDDTQPACDLCGFPMTCCSRGNHSGDWNGETGNHLSCEREWARYAPVSA